LALSVMVFLHCPEHSVPMAQAQLPLLQTLPAPQLLPQVPQWALSVMVFRHCPEHSVCPDGQTQSPPEQDWPPLQAMLQPPQ
jgi:hypothetical protein